MLHRKVKFLLSLVFLASLVAAQYDYQDYNTATTANPAYPSYPDYNAGTDINNPGTDYQTTDYGTPNVNYPNPNTGVNGGVDPELYPNYDNYDVMTQPPVVINPTVLPMPCNPVPRTIVNWYLTPQRSPSLRHPLTNIRRQRIYSEYKFPWNRVYGAAQYRVPSRIAAHRGHQIAKYRYGAYRRGVGAAQDTDLENYSDFVYETPKTNVCCCSAASIALVSS